MAKTTEQWLLFEYDRGELVPLSKPFKTKAEAENARLKYPERQRKKIGSGLSEPRRREPAGNSHHARRRSQGKTANSATLCRAKAPGSGMGAAGRSKPKANDPCGFMPVLPIAPDPVAPLCGMLIVWPAGSIH
jgi:hypothetical protein